MRKNYILDANILIHDPNSILQFADNTIVIPISVITEIDRFKKEMTARGYNARAVVRRLDALRNGQSLADGIQLTKDGGRLRVYCDPQEVLGHVSGDADTAILKVARQVQEEDPSIPVIIVTKDINLRIRADAAGLRAEDYETDRVNPAELYTGQIEHAISPASLAAFVQDGATDDVPSRAVYPNEYVLLKADNGQKKTALARTNGECNQIIALRETKDGLCGIRPRNKEQYFCIDALLDGSIQLVTIMGKAGTGKTLLAIAAALHQTIRHKTYRGMLIARPIFPMGRDLGYLPGDISQKLDPWMKPVADTVEFIFDQSGPIRNMADCDTLMRSHLLEIQPLTYIRGRSISNRFVLIDEAQNLTPLEVKTVITRIGQGSKIVLTGDPYQIDNPYVDAMSNGFAYLINRFRSQSVAAHIELRKGERSALAELAANLL